MEKATLYETKFTISRPREVKYSFNPDNEHWDFFLKLMNFMGSIGFYVGKDKEIVKKYPSIADTRRVGRYSDLQFKASWSPNMIEIEFYQDVNYVNVHGGYYDFGKKEKMPYLIRKQYELTERKLIRFLAENGYEVTNALNLGIGPDFIVNDYIKSWHHPQNEKFDLSSVDGETCEYSYNATDRDKKIIHNGEVKYFRGRNGYLNRGKAYHNINNMWWVLLPGGEVRNVASFELFDLSDEDVRGRSKIPNVPAAYKEKRRQLELCSTKELENELKRRKAAKKVAV